MDQVPVGKHCLFTVRNIPFDVQLTVLPFVKHRMQRIAAACNLNVIGEVGHQFEPEGCSFVLLLSESHMSIHTYPERSAAYIDIFSCHVHFDHESALRIIKESFKTESVELSYLIR